MASSVIPNGVQAIEFRNRVVDNFMADTKGSIFVGTGTPSTYCNNAYIVETINPTANVNTATQDITVKLPIYTGAGTTGIEFAAAQYLNVGAAIQATQASQAAKLGGGGYADKGDSTHPVYFSGGLPVAITKVASAAAADTAGSATHATNASKLDGGQKGSATQPIYINAAGQPCVCTSYASANVNSANYANQAALLKPQAIIPTITAAATGTYTLSDYGYYWVQFSVQGTGSRTDTIYGNVLLSSLNNTTSKAIVYLPFDAADVQYDSALWVKFQIATKTLRWAVESTSGQTYSYKLNWLKIMPLFKDTTN